MSFTKKSKKVVACNSCGFIPESIDVSFQNQLGFCTNCNTIIGFSPAILKKNNAISWLGSTEKAYNSSSNCLRIR